MNTEHKPVCYHSVKSALSVILFTLFYFEIIGLLRLIICPSIAEH